MFDDRLDGFYASPNIQGTRPGAPMAMAWAVMRHLGVDGYKALAATALGTAATSAMCSPSSILFSTSELDALGTPPRWPQR